MKLFAVAATSVLRMLRDRSNIFFVFVFPLALILVIGLQFGSDFTPRLGVVAEDVGELGRELVVSLERDDALVVEPYDAREGVIEDVGRGTIRAGLVVPPDYDQRLRSGQPVELGYVSREDGQGLPLQATVQAAVAEQATVVGAARLAAEDGILTFDAALRQAESVSEAMPGVSVDVSQVGESTFEEFEGLGQFDLGASQQLLLFVFLTSLAGSAALIQTRQLGVARRMLSTPTSIAAILGGTAFGRFGVALVQAGYIVIGSLLIFGVEWGDPLGATALVVLFSLVSAGAGMLLGAVANNDQQAGGLGVFLGLLLAALGGSMAPLELFSPTMQTVAHITPHAWALDGFAELVRRDGTLMDILPELGVLAGYAAALFGLATWALHRALVRA